LKLKKRNEETVQIISMIFFNTGVNGSEAESEEEKTNSKIILMKTTN
jgi:hypothetical protein